MHRLGAFKKLKADESSSDDESTGSVSSDKNQFSAFYRNYKERSNPPLLSSDGESDDDDYDDDHKGINLDQTKRAAAVEVNKEMAPVVVEDNKVVLPSTDVLTFN
jgi:hypothetical protein